MRNSRPHAYYNEHDAYAAQWLRNLISAGEIAPGEVDERSIVDVKADDLKGFTQCHFFAGIGIWSAAAREGGWRDEDELWTGSCPCQPFSNAGKGLGFDDERHLWPAWRHLIEERRPSGILGEQVASRDTDVWIDLVCDDVEAMGYAFGAVPFPAASVGAPHVRDRSYWMAHRDDPRPQGRGKSRRESLIERAAWESSVVSGMDDSERDGWNEGRGDYSRYVGDELDATGSGGWLSDAADGAGYGGEPRPIVGQLQDGDEAVRVASDGPGPTNGFWREADWLFCRDGKWRPVEPGTFPLAYGASSRVGRLRAYGNGLVKKQAALFCKIAREWAIP